MTAKRIKPERPAQPDYPNRESLRPLEQDYTPDRFRTIYIRKQNHCAPLLIMNWEVDNVGEKSNTGIVFDNEDRAIEEYHHRLEQYHATLYNKDPTDPTGRPWIALADSDCFYIQQDIVKGVFPRSLSDYLS
ncbi:hypothetical protein ACFL3Q_12880 [Planctomycetota bacterium]